MGGAERLWWLLRHFGHDDCAVLELDGWLGPLTGGEEEIEPGEFVPREREGDTIEADELARRLDELVIVDARLPERFRGEPNPIDKSPGRIPGARNAPWDEPLPELPDGELVAYCGSGVTACVALHRLFLRGARAGSTPAPGASGSSSACRSSGTRRRGCGGRSPRPVRYGCQPSGSSARRGG